jgi:hypothetical protein
MIIIVHSNCKNLTLARKKFDATSKSHENGGRLWVSNLILSYITFNKPSVIRCITHHIHGHNSTTIKFIGSAILAATAINLEDTTQRLGLGGVTMSTFHTYAR